MATILDGKKVAEHLYEGLKKEIAKLPFTPKLVFIRVGEDPASVTYVKAKAKRCEELKLKSETLVLDAKVSESDLLRKIETLNHDNSVNGILVQLPLPKHISKIKILEKISPYKDVDGLHPENLGRLLQGNSKFVPCTPSGIIEMLRFYKIPLAGKEVVVVGRSDIVGKPTSLLCLQEDATVTVCHSKTKNLEDVTRRADILIVAAGKPALIGKDHVKEGATVVDVGIHRVNGKLQGDVDFEKVKGKAGAISPVPGGVGPLTIACLMRNLVQASRFNTSVT